MKKSLSYIILALLLAGFNSKAQNPDYRQLALILSEKMPELNISDKIIAFHAWSASDAQSRGLNQEFSKVAHTYSGAKLKNGNKGTVIISCNLDASATGIIAAKKDQVGNVVAINISDYAFLSNIKSGHNIVYDNTKATVYENIGAGNIFNSFNQLITR